MSSNCLLIECMPGYFGTFCSQLCLYPFYGRGCQSMCSCDVSDCDYVQGCRKKGNDSSYLCSRHLLFPLFIATFSHLKHTTPLKLYYAD